MSMQLVMDDGGKEISLGQLWQKTETAFSGGDASDWN